MFWGVFVYAYELTFLLFKLTLKLFEKRLKKFLTFVTYCAII